MSHEEMAVNSASIFSESLQQFLGRCRSAGLDAAAIDRMAKASLARLAGKPGGEVHETLERRWYTGYDFTVYSGDDYLGEAWSCWHVYSKKYLSQIQKKIELAPASIADLGCGIGYTTAALREIYPAAEVYGTNFGGTRQTAFAAALGVERGFTIVDTEKDVGKTVDLVFASEYFEHFEDPIAHLESVLAALDPREIITANAFGQKAVGHFNNYIVNGEKTTGKRTSLEFNRRLRFAGYDKVETGFWNNRPSIWRKHDTLSPRMFSAAQMLLPLCYASHSIPGV